MRRLRYLARVLSSRSARRRPWPIQHNCPVYLGCPLAEHELSRTWPEARLSNPLGPVERLWAPQQKHLDQNQHLNRGLVPARRPECQRERRRIKIPTRGVIGALVRPAKNQLSRNLGGAEKPRKSEHHLPCSRPCLATPYPSWSDKTGFGYRGLSSRQRALTQSYAPFPSHHPARYLRDPATPRRANGASSLRRPPGLPADPRPPSPWQISTSPGHACQNSL